MLIIPLFVTAPHVLLDSETPQGIIIQPPEIHDSLSDGFILIILDGVGENWMLDEVNMPLLNERRETGATLNLRTGPLTLSATCVSEIMNGVPNSPSDGLRNFNLEHPGGDDAWTLASEIGVSNTNSPYNVGLVGSYVYGNMYGDMENNPLFGNLMQQMNSKVDSENKSDNSDKDTNKDTNKDTENELTREEKKKILKNKIEEKKKERSK